MSTAKPSQSQKRADPPVTIAQLREVGLFGALSDEFLEMAHQYELAQADRPHA